MFVRVKTTPNSPRKSVQIVESVRDGDKVKQRIVRYVGIAMDDKELPKLLELAEYIRAKIECDHTPTLFSPEEMAELAIESRKIKDEQPIDVNLRSLKEEQRSIVGIHEIFGAIYKQLGFNEIFSSNNKKDAEILYHMVMARIANPASKRASTNFLEEDFGIKLNLDKVYRMMDSLDEATIEAIKDRSYNIAKDLFGKIDVIFFDATTLYFESFTEDELKQNGYSKDLKFNQPQVLLALLVTKDGIPLGYEAFPGAYYEGHSVLPVLKKLKENYNLDKVVFVADAGMLNAKTLELLESNGYEYIVGARIKNFAKEISAKILDQSGYKKLNEDLSIADIKLSSDKHLIVSLSEKRKKKDANDREKAINKITKKLKSQKNIKNYLSQFGYKKFLKLDGATQISIDEEKLQKEALWDGLHGIITNSKNLSSEEILQQYKGLWQVEESFRICKHDLKIRPIYHWTPDRIRAHLAIVYTAFTCARHLEYRIGLQYQSMSIESIRHELTRIQVSILKDPQGQRYVVPSSASQDGVKIYQVMGIKYSTMPYRLVSTKPKFNK